MTRIFSAVSALALGLSLSIAVPVAASAAPAPQTITITTATAGFAPSQITVQSGQQVTLKFVGNSGVHGIESKDLGISSTMITPGSTKTVTFTAPKAGTYTLHCTVMCGPDHAKMAIVIKVTA